MESQKRKKERLDRLLLEKGLVKSGEKARALILEGKVLVNGQRIDKAGKYIDREAALTLIESPHYVGRGGVKLEGALNSFSISVKDRIALDIGASTGGFTDCLLQHGAAKVYAVDVGYGLLDWKLRQDRRVILLERRNIRYLDFKEIGEKADLTTIDVSFISLEKVIPKVKEFLKEDGVVLALIKPQFEVGKGEVGKGGIVKDPEKHKQVIDRLTSFSESQGFKVIDVAESPIKGTKGNKEFWMYLKN